MQFTKHSCTMSTDVADMPGSCAASWAFVPAPTLLPVAYSARPVLNVSRRSRCPAPFVRHARMGLGGSGPNKRIESSDSENDRLYRELRSKVNELYGSADNVTIVSQNDDTVDFRVLRPGSAEATAYRSAWMTIGSIAGLAALSFAVFALLSQTGAIHTANNPRYEMPTYKTRSYVDPYSLLEQDEGLLREDAPVVK
jgi:hypothetical protein